MQSARPLFYREWKCSGFFPLIWVASSSYILRQYSYSNFKISHTNVTGSGPMRCLMFFNRNARCNSCIYSCQHLQSWQTSLTHTWLLILLVSDVFPLARLDEFVWFFSNRKDNKTICPLLFVFFYQVQCDICNRGKNASPKLFKTLCI